MNEELVSEVTEEDVEDVSPVSTTSRQYWLTALQHGISAIQSEDAIDHTNTKGIAAWYAARTNGRAWLGNDIVAACWHELKEAYATDECEIMFPYLHFEDRLFLFGPDNDLPRYATAHTDFEEYSAEDMVHASLLRSIVSSALVSEDERVKLGASLYLTCCVGSAFDAGGRDTTSHTTLDSLGNIVRGEVSIVESMPLDGAVLAAGNGIMNFITPATGAVYLDDTVDPFLDFLPDARYLISKFGGILVTVTVNSVGLSVGAPAFANGATLDSGPGLIAGQLLSYGQGVPFRWFATSQELLGALLTHRWRNAQINITPIVDGKTIKETIIDDVYSQAEAIRRADPSFFARAVEEAEDMPIAPESESLVEALDRLDALAVTTDSQQSVKDGSLPVMRAALRDVIVHSVDNVLATEKSVLQEVADPGVVKLAMLAIAGLETSWARKITTDATTGLNSRNLFNIKATNSWKAAGGQVVSRSVREYDEKGRAYTATGEEFRSYSSFADSVLDFLKLMTLPRYSRAGVLQATTPSGFIAAMWGAGYATDPKYVNKTGAIFAARWFQDLTMERNYG